MVRLPVSLKYFSFNNCHRFYYQSKKFQFLEKNEHLLNFKVFKKLNHLLSLVKIRYIFLHNCFYSS